MDINKFLMPGERIVQEQQEQMPGEHIIGIYSDTYRLEKLRGKVTVSGMANSTILVLIWSISQ
jgi:hypothetical protein